MKFERIYSPMEKVIKTRITVMSRALDSRRVRTVKEQAELFKGATAKAPCNAACTTADALAARVVQYAGTPEPKAAPELPQDLVCIGRWVVRQGIGNNCGFERTSATGLNPVRIVLDEGVAVIEVCRRK